MSTPTDDSHLAHLHVDVRGTPRVPARDNRDELDDAGVICEEGATQKGQVIRLSGMGRAMWALSATMAVLAPARSMMMTRSMLPTGSTTGVSCNDQQKSAWLQVQQKT